MANHGVSMNGNGHSIGKPILCVIADDPTTRRRLGVLLQSIGFDIHVFESGGGFLLSGLVHRCAAVLIEGRLLDVSTAELQQAMASAKVPTPIVMFPDTLPHEDDDLLRAVKSALANKPR